MNIIRMTAGAFIFLAFLVMPPIMWLILSSKVRKQLSTFALSTVGTTGPAKSQEAETQKPFFGTLDSNQADSPRFDGVDHLLRNASNLAEGMQKVHESHERVRHFSHSLAEKNLNPVEIQTAGFALACIGASTLYRLGLAAKTVDRADFESRYHSMSANFLTIYLNIAENDHETEQ